MDVFRVYVLIIDRQNNVALVKFARVVRWAPCGYRISAVKKWSLASSSKRNWEHSARTDEEVVDLAAIEHKPHLQMGQGQAGSAWKAVQSRYAAALTAGHGGAEHPHHTTRVWLDRWAFYPRSIFLGGEKHGGQQEKRF
jgi:hypothetical protein